MSSPKKNTRFKYESVFFSKTKNNNYAFINYSIYTYNKKNLSKSI